MMAFLTISILTKVKEHTHEKSNLICRTDFFWDIPPYAFREKNIYYFHPVLTKIDQSPHSFNQHKETIELRNRF